MRVAIFTNNYLPRLSGVSIAVGFMNRALNEQGHETMIIAPDYGSDPDVPGVHVERVTSIAIPKLKLALTLQDLDRTKIHYLIRGFRPDIIHTHHPFLLGESALIAADEMNVPLVYTFHTLYEAFAHYLVVKQDAIRRMVREYIVRCTEYCDLVVTPTEPIKEYLQSLGATTRIESVPTGIDFSRFRKVTPDQIDALRKRYALDRFDHILLSVGRISREKNVQLCLDTLEELTNRGGNFGLLTLGEGPVSEELVAAAESKGLGDRLIMGGFLEQATLAAAYYLGSVFLFPSTSDTQGIVLYEAQAAGLPIVATETMASRAAVKPGHNGLFAENCPQDFAGKVQQIVGARERFSWPFDDDAFSHETIGKIYDRLYRETIDKGRRPKPEKRHLLEELIGKIKKHWDKGK